MSVLSTIGGASAKGFGMLHLMKSSFVSTESIQFNGLTQYIDVPNNAVYNITNNLSISIWFNASNIGGEASFFTKTNLSNGWAWFVERSYVDQNKIAFGLAQSSSTFSIIKQGSQNVFNSAWHNMVITYANSNASAILYVDGVLDASTTYLNGNSGTSLTSLATNTQTIMFAGINNGGGKISTYNGELNNASVWNVVLSQSDVTAIYNSGKPGDLSTHAQAAHLVGWWKLGNGDTIAANGILDSTTNANNGTPTGSPTIVNDAP